MSESEIPPPSSSAPERIDLKIGFACNNRCLFCVQGDKRHRYAAKPAEELRALMAAERPRVDAIVFTGGEPTIRPDLPELVAHARALGYRTIQIQTNGRRFAHRGYAQKLIESGANEFSPALHGHCAELHDYLTSAPGAFAQTVTGIRNLKALGQYVLTNTVVTKSNYRHLPEIAQLLVSLGVDQFQFAFVHPVGTAGEQFERIVPRMELASPYLRRALQVGRDAGRPANTEAVPFCLLPGYEDCVIEQRIPRTTIFDAESTIADYTDYRQAEGKLKGPVFRACTRFQDCEGPWREYPEKLGWSEFHPLVAARTAGGGGADAPRR